MAVQHCGGRYRWATKLAMLYERWLQTARDHGSERALVDLAAGESWTFRQLAGAGADGTADGGADGSAVICPRGNRAAFIFDVLRAWRAGTIVCPLDDGQPIPAPPPPPAGIVHLKLTSATTQAARMIAFTAAQLAADAEQIVRTMGLRRDWPNLGAISLAHSYGYSNLVLPLLLHGLPLFLLDSTLPEAVRQAERLAPHLTLAAVPALWRAWHEAGAIPANVRLGISAGAPLPLALETAVFEQSGLKVHNFYGASECGGIAYDATAGPRSDETCVGTPMEGVRLQAQPGGCLEVRSPAVAEGYWPEPQANLGNGCFRSSDLVDLDGGSVRLRGRAGDQINIAGRKVSPEAIERELLQHPQVRDCLVFGTPLPGHDRAEMIVACVVLQSPVPADGLRQFLLSRLPAWQVPREWKFVPTLSPNARGKLSRLEWRQRLGFAPG